MRNHYPIRSQSRKSFSHNINLRDYGGHSEIYDRITKVGFINYDSSYSTDICLDLPDKNIYLRKLSINYDLRGEGIGTDAYRVFERQMRRKGVREIVLVPENSRAARFWKRQGFKFEKKLHDGKPLWSKTI